MCKYTKKLRLPTPFSIQLENHIILIFRIISAKYSEFVNFKSYENWV